jgi:transposase
LRAKSIPGRPSYLAEAEKEHLAQVLLQGARAAGYRSELWTRERIATVIWCQFRVRYHPHAIWRLLRTMGWSCQKPERRAWQRDEAAIVHWRRYRWPHIKKGCPVGGALGFPG